MSTQYDTGQTYQQYQDEIKNGPAALPVIDASYTSGVAARTATTKSLAGALASTTASSPVTYYSITAVSADGTHVTFTAANNLVSGQQVRLTGLGGRFAALNGSLVTVVSTGLSATQFEIASAVGAPTTFTVTATSGSGTAVTFTAANTLVAGDQVTFAGLAAPYDVFNTGTYTVLSAGLSGTQFEVASAVSGATTTGTGGSTAATTTGKAGLPTPGPALPSVGINASAVQPYVTETTAPVGP